MNAIFAFLAGFFQSLFASTAITPRVAGPTSTLAQAASAKGVTLPPIVAAKIAPNPILNDLSFTPAPTAGYTYGSPSLPTSSVQPLDAIVAPAQPDPDANHAQTLSDHGLRLIQLFEQCRLVPYRDSRGYWTVGWGHALTDTQGNLLTDMVHARASMTRLGFGGELTQAQADELFMADLKPRVEWVVKETSGCTQHQLDAMVSLTFNIGNGGFGGSHVRSFHNAGHTAVGEIDLGAWANLAKTQTTAANMTEAFLAWSETNHQFALGLFRRRACEVMVYAGLKDPDAAYQLVEAFHA